MKKMKYLKVKVEERGTDMMFIIFKDLSWRFISIRFRKDEIKIGNPGYRSQRIMIWHGRNLYDSNPLLKVTFLVEIWHLDNILIYK